MTGDQNYEEKNSKTALIIFMTLIEYSPFIELMLTVIILD